MPAAAASGVSAATTAIGSPAHAGSAVSGLSPVDRQRCVRADRRADARGRTRGVDVERGHPAARDGRAQDGRVEHPRQLDVDGVARRAARAHRPVLADRRRADDPELRVVGPRLDLVLLVDEDPHVLEPALHLPLGLDEPRLHATSCPEARRIARSILGYAPQRQMLPAIAARISSRVGRATEARSAVADTICPGVQKPH